MDNKFLGYCMTEDGDYEEPVSLDLNLAGPGGLNNFLDENVAKHYELRVCNADDEIILHVVNQALVFPIPEGGTMNNKWDDQEKKFIG